MTENQRVKSPAFYGDRNLDYVDEFMEEDGEQTSDNWTETDEEILGPDSLIETLVV